MSAQHTPGPWRTTQTPNDPDFICEIDNIAAVYAGNEQATHDARLIAAAPDLLEALQGMLMGAYHDCAAVRARRDKAHAAIAKATGSAA